MRVLTILIGLLALSSAQAGLIDNIIGRITGLFSSYEEVPYSVMRSPPGYEERSYPSRKWVCTSAVGSNETVMEPLFWKLFRYISGQNSRSLKISMTVPVTTEYTVSGPDNKKFEMCFFLGEDHQQDTPRPSDSDLFIKTRPTLNALTRTVGGYMETEAQWMEEAGKLAAIIQQNGESVSLNHQYWVGYDPPLKFWYRRNEVWFPVN